ncbi:MAG: class I SAM-dependent methyltransferase [Burkholderiales bacterium]|nr:class I SAM-dependent methyltransferase [Burkholderiales bacterium]
MELQNLYRHRFDPASLPAKARLWKTLCDAFFSRYVRATDTVVDIGAGYCEFINHIPGSRKIAIDLNPDVRKFAAPGIEIINEPCTHLSSLPGGSANVVFMSNFLEHLPSKDLVVATLAEAKRILLPGGRLMILQPNIRFVGHEYWDFIDHHTPLTDRSLAEALENLDMKIEVLIPRFLPYTTKSALPQASLLVRLYLLLPLAWRVLGKQAFVVAVKPG